MIAAAYCRCRDEMPRHIKRDNGESRFSPSRPEAIIVYRYSEENFMLLQVSEALHHLQRKRCVC